MRSIRQWSGYYAASLMLISVIASCGLMAWNPVFLHKQISTDTALGLYSLGFTILPVLLGLGMTKLPARVQARLHWMLQQPFVRRQYLWTVFLCASWLVLVAIFGWAIGGLFLHSLMLSSGVVMSLFGLMLCGLLIRAAH